MDGCKSHTFFISAEIGSTQNEFFFLTQMGNSRGFSGRIPPPSLSILKCEPTKSVYEHFFTI